MSSRRPALVLAYHVVGDVPRALDPHNLALSAATLRRHLKLVQRRGYRFVTVTDIARELSAGGAADGLCAVSFDDGSVDSYSVVPALLGELGIPATLFVCPGLLGAEHPFMAPQAGIRLMTGDELRALGRSPEIELGAHTMTHTVLDEAGAEQAFDEMRRCKAALEELSGRAVTSFAYPECAYSPACPGAAQRAGYEAAVTCGGRGGLKPFELRRVTLNRLDGRLALELKLRGLYHPVRRSALGVVARRLLRPIRHPAVSPPVLTDGSGARHQSHPVTMARTVLRNTTVQVVGEGLSKLASLALYVVVARVIGPVDFGQLVFALSVSALMTALAGFGVEGIVVRGVARDPAIARRLLSEAVVLKAVFGLIGVAAAVGVALAGDYAGQVTLAVAVLSVGAVLDLVAKSYYAIFQAIGDMRPPATVLLVQRLVTAVAGIAVVLVGFHVFALALAFAGASAVALGLASAWLGRRGIRATGLPTTAGVIRLARDSFPLGINNMFSTVLFRGDATMLALMKGNFAVGLYGVAYRLLESTLFITYAFTAALVPTLARLRRDTEPPVARAYELGNKVLALLLVPIGAFLVAFPHLIVHTLYGSQYLAADVVMRVLGGAAVLYGFAYLAGYALVVQDHDRVLPWVHGFAAAQNIGMNFALIPPLSYTGAAISTTVCEGTRTVALMWYAVKAMGPIRLGRILLAPAAGTAAIALVVLGFGVGWLAAVFAALAYAVVVVLIELLAFPGDAGVLRATLTRTQIVESGVLHRAPAG